jgi:hypothetical protein
MHPLLFDWRSQRGSDTVSTHMHSALVEPINYRYINEVTTRHRKTGCQCVTTVGFSGRYKPNHTFVGSTMACMFLSYKDLFLAGRASDPQVAALNSRLCTHHPFRSTVHGRYVLYINRLSVPVLELQTSHLHSALDSSFASWCCRAPTPGEQSAI